jgi:hypothetical protein
LSLSKVFSWFQNFAFQCNLHRYDEVQHRATNLLDGCRTFGPENLLTETSDLKRRLDASLEDLEERQGKYDKLRGSLALIDIRIAAKWVHLYHRARLSRVRKVHNGHTNALKTKISQLTVALARSNMVKGGAGGGAAAAAVAKKSDDGGKAAAAARHRFEEAAQANNAFSTFLRVGTGPSEMIDLTQLLPAPPVGSDPGAFIPSKPDLSASVPSSSRPGTTGDVGGRGTTRPSGAGAGAGGMGLLDSAGGGGDAAAMAASRRAAEIHGRGSPLRESRQQSRDKAALLRPVSTPQRVAAGEAPLQSLEVLLPDDREMYTVGLVQVESSFDP